MKKNKINTALLPGLSVHFEKYFKHSLNLFYLNIKDEFLLTKEKDELIATHIILIHYLKEKLNSTPEEITDILMENWEIRLQEVKNRNIKINSNHYIEEISNKKWEDEIIDPFWL